MTLKTPSFWYRKEGSSPSKRERLLTPISKAYAALYKIDHAMKSPYKANMPVFCIGNITAGGTGKTPTAIALLKLIENEGLYTNPYFLIRGYGGAETGPLLVDPKVHTAWDVGDEALILAQHAPTIIGGDRAASAKLGAENGANCLIMDDGLQNPGIQKDVSLVVINGEMGFGNGKMMPAGPMRQPLQEGLQAADGFIFIGDDLRSTCASLPTDKPVIRAKLHPKSDYVFDQNKKYLAFAGLGYPQKFFNFLEKQGLQIADTISFSDHHPYIEEEILEVKAKADALGATLITTEKDLMRIPSIDDLNIEAVPVELHFEDPQSLLALLKSVNNH